MNSAGTDRISSKPELSRRDVKILLLLGEGLQNKEIAAQLGLSLKTLEFHKRRLYVKIGVTGLAGAVRFAIRDGHMEA